MGEGKKGGSAGGRPQKEGLRSWLELSDESRDHGEFAKSRRRHRTRQNGAGLVRDDDSAVTFLSF